MMVKVNYCNNLKGFREAQQLSPKHLAAKLQISEQTIYAIEEKKYNLSVELAFHITSYFETSIEKMFYVKKIDD